LKNNRKYRGKYRLFFFYVDTKKYFNISCNNSSTYAKEKSTGSLFKGRIICQCHLLSSRSISSMFPYDFNKRFRKFDGINLTISLNF
jgi:hypothetical protein